MEEGHPEPVYRIVLKNEYGHVLAVEDAWTHEDVRNAIRKIADTIEVGDTIAVEDGGE